MWHNYFKKGAGSSLHILGAKLKYSTIKNIFLFYFKKGVQCAGFIAEKKHFIGNAFRVTKCLAGFCFIFNTYFCGVLLLSVALNVSDHNYPLCLNFIAILTFTYFKKVEILCEIWLKCPKFFLMDTPKLKEYYTSKGKCVYWDKTKTKEGFFGYPKGSK